MRKNRAFSLMELLVVVSILGILVAISTPHFMRAIERTRVQEAQETLRALFESERLYQLDNGRYAALGTLVNEQYATHPDPGDTNTDWNFTIQNVGVATFTATANRTGGGEYDDDTIRVDQNFNGTLFAGSHPLHD